MSTMIEKIEEWREKNDIKYYSLPFYDKSKKISFKWILTITGEWVIFDSHFINKRGFSSIEKALQFKKEHEKLFEQELNK